MAEAAETVLLLRLGLLAPFRFDEMDEMTDLEVENMMLVQGCINQYEAAMGEVKSGMASTPDPVATNGNRRQPPPGALRVGRQRASQ